MKKTRTTTPTFADFVSTKPPKTGSVPWLTKHKDVGDVARAFAAMRAKGETTRSWADFSVWLRQVYGCPLGRISIKMWAERAIADEN